MARFIIRIFQATKKERHCAMIVRSSYYFCSFIKKIMPENRLALIRYKTIDRCLCNRFRRWTLDDLIEACSEALHEFEGKVQGVSRRTVQLDIQNMRSEKLGYEAPIVVVDKKYYQYEDPEYSITNMPLTENDVSSLKQITHLLKQFGGFKQFGDMDEVLKKIENKVFALNNESRSIIDFEKNNDLKGIHFLDQIYDAIIKKQTLKIVYLSFNQSRPVVIYLSPYLLKEYRNRWFVFGKRERYEKISPLALDRILRLRIAEDMVFVENTMFDEQDYFKDIIGVTRHEKLQVEKIVFKVVKLNAQYVVTKPFHGSQQVVQEQEDGTVFSIDVIPNFELERELLGFGELLEVIEPESMRTKIYMRVEEMQKLYKKT
jgi:predicted DNA-binding transcriptional regulator YafY